MAGLLIGMSVMAVMLGVVLPVWHTAMRREREAELVFRGEQYVHAIEMYQRRYAGTFPPSVDVLLEQRFLRRRYQDPVARRDFRLLYVGADTGVPGARRPEPATPGETVTGTAAFPGLRAGIVGVVSTSTETALRTYKGRSRYDEWAFVAVQAPRAGIPAPPLGGASPKLPPQPPGRARLSPPR